MTIDSNLVILYLSGIHNVPRLLVIPADQVAADERAPVPANQNAAVIV